MTEQIPGFYRRSVGGFVVTAINDGYLQGSLSVLRNITPEAAGALLTERFRPLEPRLAINAYLVQGGGRTVLIDTGTGGNMGPGGGKLLANLAAAGVMPGDVDLILITHLHPDHTGGLATKAGAAVFPNAGLAVSEADAVFWLDQAPEKVSEGLRPTLAGAQAAVAPYHGRLVRGDGGLLGITAVPLPGHSPGHTGYRVADGAAAVLIWGDVMHFPDIQAARPEVGVMFDLDGPQAVATRRHVLDMVATERLSIAGMHMHFPGFAHVARAGDAYEIIPEAWSPEV